MSIYKVPVFYSVCGDIEVEAESKEDLMKKLKDNEFLDELPLPDETCYIEGSFEINFDVLEYELEKIDTVL